MRRIKITIKEAGKTCDSLRYLVMAAIVVPKFQLLQYTGLRSTGKGYQYHRNTSPDHG